MAAGCGDIADLEANLPGGAEQAAINGSAAALSSIDINEGGSTSLVISSCLNGGADLNAKRAIATPHSFRTAAAELHAGDDVTINNICMLSPR